MNALRVPAFRRLAAAWAFSNFGDSALYLTLAIWVKDLTASDAAAGLVFLFLGLPVFLAPFAGHLADRFSRRRLVVAANLVAAVGVLALVLVRDGSDVWLIYLITFGYGFLGYLTSACGAGLVRDMLDDDELAGANGLLSTIDQGLRLLSPLAGAGLYAVFGGAAVAGLTSTMLMIAAAIVVTIRLRETPPTAPEDRRGFWPELTAGARHIRRAPVLARLTVVMAVAFCITGFANSAIFSAIDEGLGRDSTFFGALAAVQGGGSVVGGLTAAFVIRRLGELGAMTAGLALLGIGLAGVAVASTAVVGAAAGLVGLAIPWTMVAFVTLRQRLTPGWLQGRVSAAMNMALNGPQTIGTAVGAALIAVVDYRILVLAMGAVVTACAVPIAIGPRPPATADSAASAPELISADR